MRLPAEGFPQRDVLIEFGEHGRCVCSVKKRDSNPRSSTATASLSGQIAKSAGKLSPSTLTHHFRVLREAGITTQRYQGTAIFNALRREDMEQRFPGLLDAVMAAE